MNKLEKEKRNRDVLSIGEKTEEGRLKITKIEKYRDDAYNYKINTIFWAALTALETLIRYVTTDKSLKELIPISIVPLIAFLFNKVRTDRKVYNLEEEVLKSK